MLAQRLRRSVNINPTLCAHVVFAVIICYLLGVNRDRIYLV